MPAPNLTQAHDRNLLLLLCTLLTLCFITGGSSQQSGVGIMVAQLLAIPVLLYSLLQAWRNGRIAPARLAIGVLMLIVLIPLLQLLPIPQWLWNLPSSRLPLQHDLGAAGVDAIDHRWSLAPAATERALLSLLPAVALFFATIALGRVALRQLLWLVVCLGLFSLLLAIAQLGVAQDSFLNPFPQFAPALAGVFANRNHQAGTLAIALVLSIALMLDARRRAAHGQGSHAVAWIFAALAVLFALALPLIGSRAGVIVAIVPIVVVVMTSGAIPFGRLRSHRPTQLVCLIAVGVLAAGIYSALGWMQSDAAIDGSRWMLTQETALLGVANAPLGGGVGSFVPLFHQGAEASTRIAALVNHAHDEYPQWWLEAGVPGALVLIAALVVLIIAFHRLMQLPTGSTARSTGLAASMAIFVILLHSCVDYPLRTPALMAMAAMLAGIVISAATLARECRVS